MSSPEYAQWESVITIERFHPTLGPIFADPESEELFYTVPDEYIGKYVGIAVLANGENVAQEKGDN